MDSLVTQWKVDIRPDTTPITNMDQDRLTMVNMDVMTSCQQNQNFVKITMLMMGGSWAANLKVTVPIGHTMY